jgi:hypothetical protein
MFTRKDYPQTCITMPSETKWDRQQNLVSIRKIVAKWKIKRYRIPEIKGHTFEKQKYHRWLSEVYRTIVIVERL